MADKPQGKHERTALGLSTRTQLLVLATTALQLVWCLLIMLTLVVMRNSSSMVGLVHK